MTDNAMTIGQEIASQCPKNLPVDRKELANRINIALANRDELAEALEVSLKIIDNSGVFYGDAIKVWLYATLANARKSGGGDE